MLAFRSLDPFRALREPDRRRRDEERLSRSEQRTLSKTQNNHLTGKAPYKVRIRLAPARSLLRTRMSLPRNVRAGCCMVANTPACEGLAGSTRTAMRSARGTAILSSSTDSFSLTRARARARVRLKEASADRLDSAAALGTAYGPGRHPKVVVSTRVSAGSCRQPSVGNPQSYRRTG
jgi:hypothetical protein